MSVLDAAKPAASIAACGVVLCKEEFYLRILHGELLLQEAELRGEQRFDVTRRRIQADAAAVVPCYHRHADAETRDDTMDGRDLLLLTELRYTYPGETCRRVERCAECPAARPT